MFDYKNSSLEEFWKFVASHLESRGIGATLVGGAVATIYSKGGYESGDLDLVFDSMFQDRSKFEEVLKEIGIEKIDQRNFKHPEGVFSLEAKQPPIEIGHFIDLKKGSLDIDLVDVNDQKIKIISPTDCIKDRLYKADEWNDDDAFEAALLVAKEVGFDEKKLRHFCKTNGKEEILEKFLNRLQSN